MYTEKTINVNELRELFLSQDYDIEIDTPDGFQSVTDWFDKGPMELVTIRTTSNQTTCATNHLVQVSVNDELRWLPAGEVTKTMKLLTVTGVEEVIQVSAAGMEECYDFTVAHSNHRYWGDGISSHNSGKSFICSGNVVKNAQKMGIYVVLIDTENALDESWLHALGVETSEDKLLKLSVSMIDDIAKTISEFVKDYKELPEDNRPQVLFVIDSLGMAMTPTDLNQFNAGEMKGDMGRKPKALKSLVTNCVNMFGNLNIGLVATNHSYASQDPYNPDPVVSGGSGFVYASSILVGMKKLKLKEDADGNKVTEVLGIRSGCKVVKSRYAKPFEDIELQIPYETGMSPYTGMFEMLEKRKLVTKEGNRYSYTDLNGEIHKYFRKEWLKNTNQIYDLVMKEFEEQDRLKNAKDLENTSTDTNESE